VLRMLFYRNGWLIKEGLPTPYESAIKQTPFGRTMALA
jgi:hypothetical protein